MSACAACDHNSARSRIRKSMEIHGNHTVTRTCYHLVISFPRTLCQSSAEVERDSGLAKEIVRALSREKKNVACVRWPRYITTCNHKIAQAFFPCFYTLVCLKTCLQRISKDFETLNCKVSQLPDSQQVELEVRGIKADVKEMTDDRNEYTFNIMMISTRRIRIVGTLMPVHRIYIIMIIHNIYYTERNNMPSSLITTHAWYSTIRLACNLQKLGCIQLQNDFNSLQLPSTAKTTSQFI